jgi:MYXO-CTERM domain-containing protein
MSGQSEVLTFEGSLTGSIDRSVAFLHADFAPLSKLVTLGDNAYDIRLLPLSLNQSPDNGSLPEDAQPTEMARVYVHPGPSPALDTPEPGTWVLACLGIVGLEAMRRRRADW